ncbi:MAG: porin family protein [Desulfobulbaceae bacterium]|nr:porin family protein [Desulfobulbaceae bacterium]
MKKTLSLLAVLAVAGLTAAPSAEASTKYVSAMAGVTWLQDYTANESNDWSIGREEIGMKFDAGLTLAAAIGCDYGTTRLEAEAGYQNGGLNSGSFIQRYSTGEGVGESVDTGEMTGDVNVLTLMGNGYYDIDLGGAELYLFAGAGVAQVSLDDVAEVYDGETSEYNWNASETALAYQLGAGIAIPVSKGVKLDARYRYFATTDFTISDDLSERNNEYPGYDREWTGNISSHSVLLGLRVDL